jgi:hypothetical protein
VKELNNMDEKLYDDLRKEVKPYIDLRDDLGHNDFVEAMTIELSKRLHVDPTIPLICAIFHDTGYHVYTSEKLRKMMSKELSSTQIREMKATHQIEGSKLANRVLTKYGIASSVIAKIEYIVLHHDEDCPCLSIEEEILRDADKLWRYSKVGFWLDVKRRRSNPLDWYEKLKLNFDKPRYFNLAEGVNLAKELLEERKLEFESVR